MKERNNVSKKIVQELKEIKKVVGSNYGKLNADTMDVDRTGDCFYGQLFVDAKRNIPTSIRKKNYSGTNSNEICYKFSNLELFMFILNHQERRDLVKFFKSL